MNISPVANFSYKPLNFKGKDESNPIEYSKESLQNNGFEIKIPPEMYTSMCIDKSLDALKESGMYEVDKDGAMQISQAFDTESEEFDMSDMTADLAIMSLNAAASMKLSDVPKSAIIPSFVDFKYENYIINLEKTIDDAKEQILNMELPDMDEIAAMEESMEPQDHLNPEFCIQRGLAMLPEILEAQTQMLESFKSTKASALKNALAGCSRATNSILLKAIQCGFDGNARGVVTTLIDNFEMYNEPQIVDNQDGTVSYLYTNVLGTQYEVIKDKANGDYISASQKGLDGKTRLEVDFNSDGSIKRLDMLNEIDKSLVYITQKQNRVIAKQIFNGLVTESRFILDESRNLRQTGFRMFFQ